MSHIYYFMKPAQFFFFYRVYVMMLGTCLSALGSVTFGVFTILELMAQMGHFMLSS